MSDGPATDGPAADDARLRAAAAAWLAHDPDPTTRQALAELLAAPGDDDDARADLVAAFAHPLRFGTAGLRGRLGPGPGQMNRVVVRRAAAGLVRWLDDHDVPGPVVVGRDARHGSAEFLHDTAAVVAGAGRAVVVLDGPVPTPLLAFAARRLDAAAGVMVTASHNPPADNGYKVYGPDAAQIVAPADAEIAVHMDAVDLATLPLADPETSPLVQPLDPAVVDDYVAAVAATRVVSGTLPAVEVVATSLHGVGGALLGRALVAAGLGSPHVVDAQAEPDPDFPTVAFPNPEEPGAMDLVLALAADTDADVALANDPDADRLAVAVPHPHDGADGWRVLSGDELGVLLADHLLSRTTGDRLVVTTIVSSSLLAAVAAAHGVTCVTTLTGFKWLARARLDHPDLTPVLGYEEALGYSVFDVVRDKDGISAAVVAVEAVAALAAAGSSVPERLAELAVAHGLHRTRQHSLRYEGADGPAAMAAAVDTLRREPPTTLDGRPVTSVVDLAEGGALPPTDAVVVRTDGIRVIVRPSGTEPKLKCYVEVVEPVASVDDVPRAIADADARIDAVVAEVVARLT